MSPSFAPFMSPAGPRDVGRPASAPHTSDTRASTAKNPTKSSPDWLGICLRTARVLATGAEMVPFPYVQGIFEMAVMMLETAEQVQKNREGLKDLCEDTVEILKIVRDQISEHGDVAAARFMGLCKDLEKCLQEILDVAKNLQRKPRGFFGRVKEIAKLPDITAQIDQYQSRIRTLRSNFVLTATMDTNFQVHKLVAMGSNHAASQVIQSINNCPLPSRIFHGRKMVLNKMHEYFAQDTGEQHIFLLYGLGGAGKTQIALKYIEESISHFSGIMRIDTSTQQTIDAGLKNIAVMKKVGNSPQDGLQWLNRAQAPWMLLLDNADDPKINMNTFLPQCKHGNIVITSRYYELHIYAGSTSSVSDMEESDAVELLLKSARVEEGGHTWEARTGSRDCEGAFIAKSVPMDRYLEIYAHNRAQLLSERPSQSHDDYAWTVYTTWQISFEQLSEGPKALLQLCSFLHHQGISEKIFRDAWRFQVLLLHNSPEQNKKGVLHSTPPFFRKLRGKSHSAESYPLGKELQQFFVFIAQLLGPTGAWDSFHFMELTNELRSYSLVNLNIETGIFSIHPLVHSWSQTTLVDPEVYHAAVVSVVGMSIASTPNEDLTLDSLLLLPHVESLLQGRTHVMPDFGLQFGIIYQSSAQPKKARDLYIETLENQRKVLGDDHPITFITMHNLAWVYHELGQWDEAKTLEVVTLEKRKKVLGDDDPYTLGTMGQLAATYNSLGQWKEAKELDLIVLEKERKIFGEEHPQTLRTMTNLAVIYGWLGQLKEAEELEVVVLEKRKRIRGENHPDTLRTMGNLASTYRRMGQLDKAEQLASITLERQKEVRGTDHPETLLTMHNLAWSYIELGQIDKGEELQFFTLEKRKKVLGEDHPDTVSTMHNLTLTYFVLDQFEQAESLGVVTLEKEKKIWGEDRPMTLWTMHNLAWTYVQLGQLDQGMDLGVLTLERRKKVLGEDHPDTLSTMHNLVLTYLQLDHLDQAEQLGVVTLEKQEKILGEVHSDTLSTMADLALIYMWLGQFHKAEQLGVVTVEKRKKLLGEDDPDTLSSMGDLALAYLELGQLDQAKKLGIATLDKQKKILEENHPDILLTMHNLALTYY
ncbi:hypothetical protein DFH07DRAFT_947527 [Mycena maculata]|uniref:TPR-like protein n=1 Tax=Mycena maculata TaxID=230809 RepID=A0AAD7HCU6_9AGAR|nr:hypothetical protein DFH07DRAFT_947527 [Mycena maculata]